MEWTTHVGEKDRSPLDGLSKVGPGRPAARQLWTLAVFGVLWSMLIAHLSPHWSANPQYSFGWLVPFLCAYLLVLRWRTRPPAQLGHSAVARCVFWGTGFGLLPTWLVAQANSDWRLIGWLLAVEIVADRKRYIRPARDGGSGTWRWGWRCETSFMITMQPSGRATASTVSLRLCR